MMDGWRRRASTWWMGDAPWNRRFRGAEHFPSGHRSIHRLIWIRGLVLLLLRLSLLCFRLDRSWKPGTPFWCRGRWGGVDILMGSTVTFYNGGQQLQLRSWMLPYWEEYWEIWPETKRPVLVPRTKMFAHIHWVLDIWKKLIIQNTCKLQDKYFKTNCAVIWQCVHTVNIC